MDIARLGSFLVRIRNPLTIIGLMFAVLYGIYQKILGLNIFSSLRESSTAEVINAMMFYLFVLAMSALFLGIIAYIVSILINRVVEHNSDLRILDTHVIQPKNRRKQEQQRKDD